MKEVKSPKKPLIYYYGVAILVIFLFNMIVSPLLMKGQIKEVDYGTFMSMIDAKNIGEVEVEDNQIVFTDKNNEKIYKTMGRVGGGNIAMGAVLVVVGVATGVLMIVSGAKLLLGKSKILF